MCGKVKPFLGSFATFSWLEMKGDRWREASKSFSNDAVLPIFEMLLKSYFFSEPYLK